MEQIQDVSDVERLAGSLGPLPEPAARPALVVMSGLPGTGKTYFCDRLSKRLPLVILESDSLRKVLFSSPTYSAEESFHLFQTIHRLIEQLLRKMVSLILDATNLSERHREYLYSIANRLDVKLVLARIKAPPEIVQARLKRRLEHPEGNSDANLGYLPENEGLSRNYPSSALHGGYITRYYSNLGQACERNRGLG